MDNKQALMTQPYLAVLDTTPGRKQTSWLETARADFDKCAALIKARDWSQAEAALPVNIVYQLRCSIRCGIRREEKDHYDKYIPPITIDVTFSDAKQSSTRQWSVSPYLTVGELIKGHIEITRPCWTPVKGWLVFYNEKQFNFSGESPFEKHTFKQNDKILIHSPHIESDDNFK